MNAILGTRRAHTIRYIRLYFIKIQQDVLWHTSMYWITKTN